MRDTTNRGDAIVSARLIGPLRDRPISVTRRRLSTSADNCAAGPGRTVGRSIGPCRRRRRRRRRNRAQHLESASLQSPPALVDAEKKPSATEEIPDGGAARRGLGAGHPWTVDRASEGDGRPTGRTKSVRFYRSRSRPRCAGSRENLPSCDVRDFYPPVLSVAAK